MSSFLEEYLKHSALNFGQALQGIRYLFTHPDVDMIAAPGTLRHAAKSLQLRSKRIANDLWFALIPPHWHHTPDELKSLRSVTVKQWFQAGYGPYRFAETGEFLSPDKVKREPRWDPRCND